MPGSALWLLPPPTSPLNKTLQTLITSTLPPLFPSTTPPPFIPHITLTSNISLPSNPQSWLDSLSLQKFNEENLHVRMQGAEAGEAFVKKLTLRCEKTASLKSLAQACRAQATEDGDEQAEQWAEDAYEPHLSLMYSDIPVSAVDDKIAEIERVIRDARTETPDSKTARGGSVVLVPTFKPMDEWEVIAARDLGGGVEWAWE